MFRTWAALVLFLVLPLVSAHGVETASKSLLPRPFAQQLDRAGREAWIRTMLGRLDRANEAVLEPTAVARQRAHYWHVLEPFLEARPGWESAVDAFLRELNLAEEAAIEPLARQFRITIYRNFRQDRDEYMQRQATSAEILDEWHAAGKPPAEQYKVIDWLTSAIASSTSPDIQPMPSLPTFTSEPLPPLMIAQDQSTDRQIVRQPETVPTPVAVDPIRPTGPILRPSVGPAPEPTPVPFHRDTATGDLDPIGRPGTPAAPDESPTLAPPSHVAERPLGTPEPAAPPIGPRTHEPSLPVVVGPTMTPTVEPVTDPGETPSVTPNLDPVPLNPPTVAQGTPVSPGPDVSPVNPPVGPTTDVSHSTPDPNEKPIAPGAKVNEKELAARIAGNNLALRRLTAELDGQETWDATSLSKLLDKLKPLVARKDDLQMFRELLPESQRARVGALDSPGELISQLGSQISKERSRLDSEEFKGTQAQRDAEKKHLDVLSKKLANLVFGGR
ncbi:MAG: hypothetical protein JW818_07450 [Pirellulales bacterium]|nr:hypothetical protein [Pirellulales bacterium]